MRAVNIVDEVAEFVARNRLLVMFENIPWRSAAKDTDVVFGLETRCTNRSEYERRSSDEEWLHDVNRRIVKSLNRKSDLTM